MYVLTEQIGQYIRYFSLNGLQAGAFFDTMFNAAAVFSLIAIAYERYLAVCSPLQLQRRLGTTTQQGVIRALSCWMAAIIYAIPQLWMYRMVDGN